MKTPLQTYDRRHPAPLDREKSVSPKQVLVRRPRRPIALTAALILVAALIGGGSVFAWDRMGSRDQTDALADAIEARDQALATAATLSNRIEGLQARLVRAKVRASTLEDEVADARTQLLAMLGPTLPDGKHLGELYAVGADQLPPRLVIDVERWFTDQEAIDAAVADGMIEAGEIIPNGYYIRNVNPRWRTIPIDPAATISLSTYPHGDPSNPTIVSLSRFGELFSSYEGRLLQLFPYWIVVEDGKVVAIEEQFIP